jgi:RNA polymerase sigma factor (sigma-70 family)
MAIFEELIPKVKKHDIDNFKAWLYTLTKNHCLMLLRSEKKGMVVNIDTSLMQYPENGHLKEHLKELEFCMGELLPEQRRAIQMFYLQDKCYKEIAELTGMDWNKVRSYIQNGKRNLKICMDKQKTKSFAQ